MGRVLYIVAREKPLLSGYLMARVGARSSGGHHVEIKVDERRGERRRANEVREPDRRARERRVRPSLATEIRSRGYATVVQADAAPARMDGLTTWQPRSRWRQGRRWKLRALIVSAVLAVVGGSIAVDRYVRRAAPPVPASQLTAPVEKAPLEKTRPPVEKARRPVEKAPSGPAKSAAVEPATPTPPPSRPAPVRIVTTRASGLVLSVNERARALVLEDRGAETGQIRVEVAPDARVVLSERVDRSEDPSYPFKDTVIDLSDIKPGDFVVVQLQGPEGKELARSVMVTFRPR